MNKKPGITSAFTRAPLGTNLIVLASFFYGTFGIWATLMGDFFGGYTASGLRAVLVLMIMVPIAAYLRQLSPPDFRRNWRMFAGLILTASVVWGPLYYAFLNAGIGITFGLNYASIMLGLFLFGRIIGERLTPPKWLAAALGIIGIWLVFTPNLSDSGWLPLVAAVVSGFGIAGTIVLSKKLPYQAIQSAIALWAATVVANAPMAFIFREPIPEVGRHIEWLYLLIFAIASVVASWLYLRGVQLVDASVAGVLGLLEIVFGVLFGLLIFNETLGLMAGTGLIVIIVAAAIPYLRNNAASN